MKTLVLIVSITLLSSISIKSQAQNVITAPASSADNVITPTGTGYQSLTINGTSGDQAALQVTNSNDWDAIDGVSTNGVGCYGASTNFVGIYGTSQTGNSAYFQSTVSTNAAPTVLIQTIGTSATANLLEFQSYPSNTTLSSVDYLGVMHASSGLQLDTTSSEPTCNSTNRGLMYVVRGGTGVADKLQVCMKASNGSYSWVTK